MVEIGNAEQAEYKFVPYSVISDHTHTDMTSHGGKKSISIFAHNCSPEFSQGLFPLTLYNKREQPQPEDEDHVD